MSATNGKAKSVEPVGLELPTVPEFELSLLGAIAAKPELIDLPDVAKVEPIHFSDPAHRELFVTMRAMVEVGAPFNRIVLAHAMQDTPFEGQTLYSALHGSEGFLSRLFEDGKLHASTPGFYADEMLKAYRQRAVILALHGGLNRIKTGDDPEQAAATAAEHIQRVQLLDSKSSAPPLFPVIGMRKLLSTDYTQDWIVPGMVTRFQPHLTAGHEKTLKTTLLLYLFICICLEGKFLGRQVKERLRVLFMTSESGEATIQETIIRICNSMSRDPMDLDDWLYIAPTTPKLGDERHMDELRRLFDQFEPDVVGFDPLYMMLNGADATNLFETGDKMREATDLCLSHRVTPFFCHHMRKNATETGDPALENVAYSGFTQHARQWFLIRREQEYKPGSGEHRLAFVWGGSAGQSGGHDLKVNEGVCGERYFACEVLDRSTKADRRQEAKAKAFEVEVVKSADAIDAAFRSEPGGVLTERELHARSGKGKAWDEAIARKLRTKEVETTVVEKGNGQSYPGFRRLWKTSEESAA